MTPAGRYLLVRHGRSDYNALHRLNGDPSVPVHLDATGREQAAALRERLAHEPFDLAVHTRFRRTVETLDILLDGRPVPRVECPDLDDVALGDFEGRDAAGYRIWRTALPQDARPPGGGESRVDALRRYARGLGRLAESPHRLVLVVAHDILIRFVMNALAGDDPLDGRVRAVANASVLTLTGAELERAVTIMRRRLPPPVP